MTDHRQPLQGLLSAAEKAAPGERVKYRDRIVAYGKPAIDALTPWLQQPRLREFAIRTIAMAGEGGERQAAIDALRTVPADVPPHITGDVADALARLGARRGGGTAATRADGSEGTGRSGDRKWTRDETVVALDRIADGAPTREQLNELAVELGRSPGSVTRKVANLLAAKSDAGGRNNTALDREVASEFGNDREKLRAEAGRIRGAKD